MEVGKISAYNLDKDFKPFYWELSSTTAVTRVIHNEEQIVRCRMRDYSPPRAEIKYFNMDGTSAAQFTLISGSDYVNNVVDMCWSNTDNKYAYIVANNDSYSIYRCLSNGTYFDTVLQNLIPDEGVGWDWASASGNVQIAAGEEDYYVKVQGSVYKIPISTIDVETKSTSDFYDIVAEAGTLSGSEVPGGYFGTYLKYPYAFNPQNGNECYNFSYQYAPYYNVPSGVAISGSLMYSWYDSPIDTVYLRSISTSGNMANMPYRWALLNIPDYSTYNYPIFINQTDVNALHYLNGSATTSGTSVLLNVFNLDSEVAAFINLNSSDILMPAGVGDTALITATVINCWGEPKEGKPVDFWIYSGDGSIIPIDTETDANGKCRATFWGGSTVGPTQINAVVNEI